MKKIVIPMMLLSVALIVSSIAVGFTTINNVEAYSLENSIIGSWRPEDDYETIMIFLEGGRGEEHRSDLQNKKFVFGFRWSISENVLAIWPDVLTAEQSQDHIQENIHIVEITAERMVLSFIDNGIPATSVFIKI